MRTTKSEVKAVFKMWVTAIGGRISTCWDDVDAYQLDYNSVYGGYRIERISNAHGGVSDIFATRLPAWEFVTALRMSLRTMEEKRLIAKVEINP